MTPSGTHKGRTQTAVSQVIENPQEIVPLCRRATKPAPRAKIPPHQGVRAHYDAVRYTQRPHADRRVASHTKPTGNRTFMPPRHKTSTTRPHQGFRAIMTLSGTHRGRRWTTASQAKQNPQGNPAFIHKP